LVTLRLPEERREIPTPTGKYSNHASVVKQKGKRPGQEKKRECRPERKMKKRFKKCLHQEKRSRLPVTTDEPNIRKKGK